VLDEPSEIIRALVRYMDIFDPRTSSLLVVGRGGRHFGADPFGQGFIAGMEERTELVRRLHRLHPRKRDVLCLTYMTSLAANEIAELVGVSRVHYFRLRRQALKEMVEDGVAEGSRIHAERQGPV